MYMQEDCKSTEMTRKAVRNILILRPITRRCDGYDLSTCLAAFHNDAGIFHREAGADIAIDPLDLSFLVCESALGDQIENVRGPVLNSDVLDFRTLESDEFDDGAVECGCLKFRRGATFHIHHLAAFVGNDESAFKLTEVFGIDAEVGLERMLHLHSWRNVDERTT